MGIVVLQVGQGGNQMGYSLFECLATVSSSELKDYFRSGVDGSARKARAVLVDMEPKVVRAVIQEAKKHSAAVGQHPGWSYDEHRVVTRDSGSGNNWARGYFDQGPQNLDAILDAIRCEVECCDSFGGFITLQSLAGGTGAGLGAYLLEALKDQFPSSFILSHCIWPYESGEVIVQNYNVLLALSHLQDFSDGVVIAQNEQLSAICRSLLGIQRPSFHDMNEVAVQALSCVLLPSSWKTSQPIMQPRSRPPTIEEPTSERLNVPESLRGVRLLSDVLTALCSHPGYRMLSLRFTPQVSAQSLHFSQFTWSAQLKYLRQMFITGAYKELEVDWNVKLPACLAREHRSVFQQDYQLINKSVANMLFLRGRGSDTADVSGFVDDRMYPIWQVDPLSVATCSSSYGKYTLAACLLSNCQSSVSPASRALMKAYNMFASKAYLHQYFQHGMESASFEAAFASVEDIVDRYSCL